MRRISSQTERRIIELWIKGIPRDTIARRTAVSGSTVSKVISQLPECLGELRKLSVELRKINSSPSEALKGAKLLSELADLRVELDQLADFIKAVKKLSRKAEYQPKQLVESAMKLSDLEEKSGNPYPEAIKEFESKTKQTKKLKEKISDLQREIENKEEERRQKLKQNKTTEKEIKYVKELRQNLRKYGISPTDAEGLQRYLKNMKETGGNPKKFVKFTRTHGSLKGRLTYLENQKQLKTLELNTMKRDIETMETEVSKRIIDLSRLTGEKDRTIKRLEELKKEIQEQWKKHEAAVACLTEILRVTADVEAINQAIEARNKELADLETAFDKKRMTLETLDSEVGELERKKQTLAKEVEGILGIKNYALEHEKAISDQRKEKSVLENDTAKKKDKIALADTITNFLTRQPTWDFNRFYSMVETVKRTREDPSSPLKPLLPRIEEEVRMQALQAFKGDLVPKLLFRRVCNRKGEIEKKNGELEKKLKLAENKRAYFERENQMLEKIEVYVEGKPRTFKELREWTIFICDEEIERRANEKYYALAAATHGTLDWIHRKITRKG